MDRTPKRKKKRRSPQPAKEQPKLVEGKRLTTSERSIELVRAYLFRHKR